MKFALKNILLYLFGLLLMGFGVILLERTFLGLGSWDSVNYSFSKLFNILIGNASIIINFSVLLFVIIYNKNLKYALAVIPIVLGGLSINFWDQIVFKDLLINDLYLKLLILILSVFILPFGLSLIIFSTLPKGIFDEATYALMKIFKSDSFVLMRIFFELFAVILSLILGFLAKIGLGQIGVGTILITFTIGPLINFYLNLFKKIFKH